MTAASMFRANTDRPFEVALEAALRRNRMTRRAAAAEAGLDEGTVARWGNGKRGAFRDQLVKLVDVLAAPELFDTIDARQRCITMTCTTCAAVTKRQPGILRGGLVRGQFPEAVIDWPEGTGAWVCVRCKQSAVGHTSPVGRKVATMRKRGGKAALVAQGMALAATLTPEQRATFIARAHEANRGRERGPAEREHQRIGHIRPTARAAAELVRAVEEGEAAPKAARPGGRWAYCLYCGQILFSRKADRPGLMHGPCQIAFRRRACRVFGPPPMPTNETRAHRRRDPRDLADAFEMAVLKLVRHVPRQVLAKAYDLTEVGVDARVRRFLDRLPVDDRGGAGLTFWASVLREAAPKGTSV